MKKAEEKTVFRRSLSGYFKGITLSRSEDGLTIDVSSLNGVDVTVITNGNGRVVKYSLAEEQTNAVGVISSSINTQAYNIGDVLPDGWIVGPISPTTSKPIAIEPVAGALEGYQTWYKGEDHAKGLHDQGHADARQPDADELNALYNGVVKAGRNQNAQLDTTAFDTSGSNPYGNYWSSTPDQDNPHTAWMQYFDDGSRYLYFKVRAKARVRCVRDEPGLTLASLGNAD